MVAAEEAASVLLRRLLPKLRSISATRFSRLAQGNLSASASCSDDVAEVDARVHSTPPPRPSRSGARSSPLPSPPPSPLARPLPSAPPTPRARAVASTVARPARGVGQAPVEVVVIGASTGGPEALSQLVSDLPPDLAAPIMVVLHVPAAFAGSLARQLDKRSALEVCSARDGGLLEPGKIYLSPGDRHLLLGRGPREALISRLSDAPPELGCRPSVDVLFRAAERVCKGAVLGVLLTGMGSDGAAGAEVLHRAGATIYVQDQQSSVVWGMPGSAARLKVVDKIVPLAKMAGEIARLVGVQ
jgi:two-component system, chemotaxis family, protein-glutamate methylesterase/glutaminase